METTPAKLVDGPLVDYPKTLIGRGLPGRVIFRCTVDADGKASEFRVLTVSHADFVMPAVLASRQWKFKPSQQGDLPVASEMTGDVDYGDRYLPPRSEVMQANGLSLGEGMKVDGLPQPIAMAEPIWPLALLLKGEALSAAVEFTVSVGGSVKDLKVREASHPECGAALLAAMRFWSFTPAMRDNRRTEVTLVKTVRMDPIPQEVSDDSDPVVRLVQLLRKQSVQGGRGLDRKLTPLFRLVPDRPYGVPDGEKGRAEIEFIIDREGRVRLPRIVSATREEFGWTAATALAQWVFEPPTRGGQATDVSVQIPVDF